VLALLRDDITGLRRGLANQALQPFFGQALFFAEGADWRARRAAFQATFTRNRLARLDGVLWRRAEAWVERLASLPGGTELDLHAEVRGLLLDMAAEALIGSRLLLAQPGLREDVDALWQEADRRTNPLGRLNPLRSARFHWSLRRLRSSVSAALTEPALEPDCLLGDLLELRRSGESDLSLNALRDEAITFLLTAHECTTLVTATTLYLTATPERGDALAAQARAILASASELRPFASQLTGFHALRQATNEAMRLFPPTWIMARQLQRATKVLGHSLPKDALLLISPFLLHRHPAHWREPEVFLPERFERAESPHAFLPFGAGPRTCIGRNLALQQSLLVCTLALCRLRLVAQREVELPTSPGLTLRPQGGLPVQLWARA
jgi:cytochrome P450